MSELSETLQIQAVVICTVIIKYAGDITEIFLFPYIFGQP